jgi:hypothetical protein
MPHIAALPLSFNFVFHDTRQMAVAKISKDYVFYVIEIAK